LASKLCADVHCLHGDDFVETILAFACEQRVTQLFLGHTGVNSRWRWWAPNAIDRLIEAAETFDVRLFPHEEDS
jgi:K+-sensing histidine kinase KdpD